MPTADLHGVIPAPVVLRGREIRDDSGLLFWYTGVPRPTWRASVCAAPRRGRVRRKGSLQRKRFLGGALCPLQ